MAFNLFKRGAGAVYSVIQRLIDDQIVQRITPYLAMGEYEGERRSEITIDENNDIRIVNCVAKPAAVDALLNENELPFHVITASCRLIHIDIPWENLSTGACRAAAHRHTTPSAHTLSPSLSFRRHVEPDGRGPRSRHFAKRARALARRGRPLLQGAFNTEGPYTLE